MTNGPTTSGADGECELLRAELETLARTRDLIKLNADQFPGLSRLAGPDADMDDIHELIRKASSKLSEREASAVSILLADSDQRWQQNLRERMTEAGRLLGISSYNTFRDRSGNNGQSPYDQFLLKLACRIESVRPSDIQDELPLATSNNTEQSRKRIAFLGGVAAAFAVLGFIGYLVVGAGSSDVAADDQQVPGDGAAATTPTTFTALVDDGTAGVKIEGCDIPLGAAMNRALAPQNLGQLVSDAYNAGGGQDKLGCPSHTIKSIDSELEEYESLWVQEFDGTPSQEAGSIIVDPVNDRSIWVYRNLAESYLHRLGQQARAFDGFPVGLSSMGNNPIMELEGGGIVIGHSTDGPAMYIPSPSMSGWLDEGGFSAGLGMPMTDVNYRSGVLTQEFEHGFMKQLEEGGVGVFFSDDAESEQKAIEIRSQLPGILIGFDGTGWWVDESSIRHYIASGEITACLGGDSLVIGKETPGWVTSKFAVGPRATCP